MTQSGLSCSGTPTPINVDVVCSSDTSCSANTKFDTYTCQVVDACPAFEKFGAVAVRDGDDDDDADGGCNVDQERRVDLSATLMGAVPGGGTVFAQFYMRNLETGEDSHLIAATLEPQVPFTATTHVPGAHVFISSRSSRPRPAPVRSGCCR